MARAMTPLQRTSSRTGGDSAASALNQLPVPELPATDPVESAKAVGLIYVSDESRGFSRRRSGKGFVYVDEHGKPLHDPEHLARIRALVIPPAWEDVWICPSPRGHIQAVGRDARGRKQYKYHEKFRQVRDETKYSRMLQFVRALPRIRRQVQRDLRKHGM